jgi:hypothetical protein
MRHFSLLLATFCIAATPALGAQCGPLRLVNSLPFVLDREGRPLIKASISGKPKFLLFDTAGSTSTVKASVVNEFHLTPKRDPDAPRNAYGDRLDRKVSIPALAVGRIRGNAWSFAVEPAGFGDSAKDIVGTLAPDIFRQFDIDLDFPAGKLNLFSPDHCEGKVLYWQAKAIAILPIEIMRSGHIYAHVSLDGKPMSALIDTGAGATVVSAAAAKRLFGLDVKPSGKGKPAPLHRFASLDFGNIRIPDPQVAVIGDFDKRAMPFTPGNVPSSDEAKDLPDLILGQSVLSKLHIYIAYRERKLFVTSGAAAQ